MKFLSSLLSRLSPPPPPAPVPAAAPRPVLYVAGSLAGEPMTPAQIAAALHDNPGHPALRGAVHVAEAYAAEALALATQEMHVHNGMAPHYLMASSFLNNMLLDLRTYAEGSSPDQPIAVRMAPARTRKGAEE